MCDAKTDCKISSEDIKEYYSKTLQFSTDLKTDVSSHCPLTSTVPSHIKHAIADVHEEVSSRYFGCGLVLPPHVEGVSVLDLGSGSGRDCFALSKLVGEHGFVTGLDMLQEMIDISSNYISYHQEKFGYNKPNVQFILGCMENLEEAGIKPASFDIIISNCVITLCIDKPAVFREAYKALKDGGEMFISDIYADQIVPEHIRNNKILYGEGFGGALWWKDLLQITQEIGFSRPRLVNARLFSVLDEKIQQEVKGINFVAATYRIVKLPKGVIYQPCYATYLGNITGYPESLRLDAELVFKKGQNQLVDSTVAAILKTSRFKSCFTFEEICTAAPVDPIKLAFEVSSTQCSSSVKCCAEKETKCQTLCENEKSIKRKKTDEKNNQQGSKKRQAYDFIDN